MSKSLTLENISIKIGKANIINDISFAIERGNIACLLGPSGCGKTTLLRSIIGFQAIASGYIKMDKQVISSQKTQQPIEQRNIGMVFQDASLFPHLTVEKNICFGIQKERKKKQQLRSAELLELISLTHTTHAYPHELSGGEQQRIALARALAPRPNLLLLDEPFSNIDAILRQQLAQDVRRILKAEDITALMVTHDQSEAFSIADQIGVVKSGRLEQWADPYILYHRPQTYFVASFIGESCFIKARIDEQQTIHTALGVFNNNSKHLIHQNECRLLIRPDDIIYDMHSAIRAQIIAQRFLGAQFIYTLTLSNAEQVLCYAPSHSQHQLGDFIGIRANIEHCIIF